MNRYKCVVTDVQATAAAAAHPDGAYVKWTDHVAEVERLRELIDAAAMNRLWVIEMKVDGKWLTSVNVRLTRKGAVIYARYLRGITDDDTGYRVRKYVREE